jgi:serine-type D-Ala-D-Ala carboxypeptidase/endopeptidase (penicillin-binding protein 4)
VFQTLARANGIVLKDPVVVSGALPDSTELVSHDSEPLRAILKDMLLYSTNLTAEAVGLGASLARGGKPATLADSAGAMNAWARAMLKLETVALVDHSGLGGDSRITAEDMVKALVAAAQSDELKPLLKSIRLDEGGQKTGAEVVAKTGTLNFVSGLAGYETCRDGSLLAFAIFAADVPRREALSEAERERPPGARDWNGRAKVLQRGLLERWGSLYGSS